MADAGGPPPAGAGGKPRLIITHMELENFKSYAGVQRVGPFHKCFSSVVGPNGSGKSNVIDALLFVFGKRAKQLRLNKVSELIHNSTHFQNLDTARVSVYFQAIIDHDDDTYEVVPDSSIVVARTAHANNSSNYYLDGRKSNYTEVTSLLKGHGIDLDNNRFLILQGEVEQIAMMKPKALTPHDEGLLEYLEDIIGSNQYVERIEAGAKELEALSEARAGVVHRVRLVEKERAGLEGAKAEAEAYLSKEAELLRWRGVQYQLILGECRRTCATIAGSTGELRERLAAERGALGGHAATVERAEGAYAAGKAQHEALAAELATAAADFAAFERKDIKYREDLKHLKAKHKKLEDKAAKDAARGAELASDAAAMEAAVPVLEASASAAAARLPAEEAALEALQGSLRGEVEAARVKLDSAVKELAPWDAALRAAQARADEAAAERALLTGKREAAQAKLAAARATMAESEAAAGSKEKETTRLEGLLKAGLKAVAAAQADEAAAKAAEADAAEALRGLRARAEQGRAAAAAAKAQSGALRALMATKASGAIPGIHGRLGDLGAIDAKYDVAVSTACAALDYIVVETADAAQAAVQLLRDQKLGVATCLILDQQRSRLAAAMREPVSPPEGVPRLYDLVKPAREDLRAAFYYGLRDTLVAADLDQARRIAYGKDSRFRRVVTLDGALIESSGTMSGGGGKPKGGRMALGKAAPVAAGGADERQQAEAEAALAAGTKRLEAARAAVAAAGAALAAAEKSVRGLELDLPKLRLEAAALRATAADLAGRLGALEAAAAADAEDTRRLAGLDKEVAAAGVALAKCRTDAAKFQAKVSELQAAMEAVGGVRLRELKAAVKATAETAASAGAEAATKRVQAAAAKKAAAKLQAGLAETQRERDAVGAEMAATKAAFAEIEEGAAAVDAAYKATAALLEHKAAALATLRAEHEAAAAAMAAIKAVEVEIEAKLEDLDRALKDNTDKARHWERKLEACRRERAEAAAAAAAAARAVAAADAAAAGGEAMETDVDEAAAAGPAGADAYLTPLLSEEELAAQDPDTVKYEVTMLESALAELKPDLGAIAEYRKKEAEYAGRLSELEAATAARDGARRAHDELRKRRLDDFMAGFYAIALKLKEMYQMITLGGDAELELVDSLDPFAEGIVFSVRPPKKSWKNISNLSGGEKTLSSLALVFALHHYKPTPLYVMDEIDAALDFKNVSIVAAYIKERTKDAQFIIISLRNNMFELADRLVGIYKTDNTTKSVAITPAAFRVGPPPAEPPAPLAPSVAV